MDKLPMRRRARIKSIFVVSSGNFLEMYDFMVFGYYAKSIGKAFFPTTNPTASLLLAFMTFGAGFLMRPVGALVLGAYIDRHGRRKGLLLTLALMGLGTLAIAAMPGYRNLGLIAPLLVLLGRLVQGFSAGVEVGGASVYLSEIAPDGQRGFYVAWQSASQQLAVIFAALVGLILNEMLSTAQVDAWGWRIPFALGTLLLPFLLIARNGLLETAALDEGPEYATVGVLMRTVSRNLGVIVIGTLMTMMTTVFFYMLTAYTPTYGNSVLNLRPSQSMLVTLLVGITNFVLLPTMGALSDRIGRKPQLIICSALACLTGYPALLWMVGSASLGRLIVVDLWLALIYAGYNGALVVYVAEIMPAKVRTTGFALAYSMATAVFGGFTPAISTWLIALTHNKASPGLWLTCAGAISFGAVMLQRRRTSPKMPPSLRTLPQ